MMQFFLDILGVNHMDAIQRVSIDFAAFWAEGRPALVFFAIVLAVVLAFLCYRKFEAGVWEKHGKWLWLLRGLSLALLVFCLAEPTMQLDLVEKPKPVLLMLMDESESMQIRDRLSDQEHQKLGQVLDLESLDQAQQGIPTGDEEDAFRGPTRLDILKASLSYEKAEWWKKLNEDYQVRVYVVDQLKQAREIALAEEESSDWDPKWTAENLKADAEMSALGNAVFDLSKRHRAGSVAGLVMWSDFRSNAGLSPMNAARQLRMPIYTVGLGPVEAVDLSLQLRATGLLKQDEKTMIRVEVQQAGLDGRQGQFTLKGRYLEESDSGDTSEFIIEGPRPVTLDQSRQILEIPWVPRRSGQVALTAKIEPLDTEVLKENNEVTREVTVRDDALRVLFIESDPTWEWRFIKEVFHRDPLVGREGFRTFLQSADYQVRRDNPLFLPTLSLSRNELFSYDVIFIGDVPRQLLGERLDQMLEEYVSRFGGGVIYLAGPNYGPAELIGTRLAQMLPVVPDAQLTRRDDAFRPVLTANARQEAFMRLGADEREHKMAWENLGQLPWYQPVRRPHPQAIVLAEHPRDLISEDTAQPLIAMRRYGRGQVIYFGFNETWRLRRMYGEKYYRQLWGQMIYQLGLSRAMGARKRFIVTTDRESYRSGQRVKVTVEAYNEDFEALKDTVLSAQHVGPETENVDAVERDLSIPLAREGVVFETSFPVYTDGKHRVMVRDPVTGHDVEVSFQVQAVNVEARAATRDAELQNMLAEVTGGQALELSEMARLPELIKAPDYREFYQRRIALWNTWLIMILVICALLLEWFARKWSHLR